MDEEEEREKLSLKASLSRDLFLYIMPTKHT